MGRHLVDCSQDGDIKNLKSGCMWKFILHVLNFHPKYDFKKIIPHQKSGRGRVIRCCANPKTDSMERVGSEAKELLLDDEPSYVETVTRSSSEASEKYKEKPKVRKSKYRHKGSTRQPQLQRTNSAHHLEPSSYGLSWMNPIILIQKKVDESSTKCSNSAPPRIQEEPVASSDLVRGHEEVLEIFKVNKELFFDVMQDHKVGVSKQSFSEKQLRKSGSFPAADSPRSTYSRLTTLEHKQNEVWFFSKREKALPSAGGAEFSSSDSNDKTWNQFVMNHFKVIKHRIKLAITEKRRRISAKPGETTERKKEASLNESLGSRYSQLFEQSFSRDVKLHQSKSIRLANEGKLLSREQTPKFFRRISSLCELESFVSILNDVSRDKEVENGSHSAPKPTSVPVGDDETKPEEALPETNHEERLNEDAFESATKESSSYREPKNKFATGTVGGILQLDHSICNTYPVDEIVGLEDHPLPGGPEMSHSTADNETDACSSYVSHLFHLSGFIGNESFVTWHSPDQPLSPSLFKDLETSYNPEEFPSSYSHRLLFDLVNDSLVEIYDREPVYFPKAFPFSRRIRSVPKLSLLADEVTGSVRCKVSSTPVQYQSLDDIVARDFAKDVWMNLQMEAECLALDLEEMIFDEVLDEVI